MTSGERRQLRAGKEHYNKAFGHSLRTWLPPLFISLQSGLDFSKWLRVPMCRTWPSLLQPAFPSNVTHAWSSIHSLYSVVNMNLKQWLMPLILKIRSCICIRDARHADIIPNVEALSIRDGRGSLFVVYNISGIQIHGFTDDLWPQLSMEITLKIQYRPHLFYPSNFFMCSLWRGMLYFL